MATTTDWHTHLGGTAVPLDRDAELLDVRDVGPPDPLVRTLETLPELPDATVLVQVNDRAPSTSTPNSRTAATSTRPSRQTTLW